MRPPYQPRLQRRAAQPPVLKAGAKVSESFLRNGMRVLVAERREARLEVINRGPPLPEAMRHQLFDSLVSLREARGERPHLGLGLYIVTLVAEFHHGSAGAENLADGSGVRFFVSLPCRDAGSA